MEVRKHNKISKVFSVIINFFCAFVIFGIIILSAGIFMTVDTNSKNLMGDYESQIFSYNTIGNNQAEITAFGEKFTIDFNKIDDVKEKVKSAVKINENFTPSIVTLSGELVSNCLSSVGKIFGKIPEIATYFYNEYDKQ